VREVARADVDSAGLTWLYISRESSPTTRKLCTRRLLVVDGAPVSRMIVDFGGRHVSDEFMPNSRQLPMFPSADSQVEPECADVDSKLIAAEMSRVNRGTKGTSHH
jgi:hypothetical protein